MNENVKNSPAAEDITAAVKDLKSAIAAARVNVQDSADGRKIAAVVLRDLLSLVDESMELFSDYEIQLTPADRKHLIGAGMKNFGFIETAYQMAEENREFWPSYETFLNYTDAVSDLVSKRKLLLALQQYEQLVADSLLDSADKAYHFSTLFYNAVKEAARQRVPKAEAIYKKLAEYFKSKGRAKTDEPTEKQLLHDVKSLVHGKADGKIVIENERPEIAAGTHKVIDEVHTERLEAKETDSIEEQE